MQAFSASIFEQSEEHLIDLFSHSFILSASPATGMFLERQRILENLEEVHAYTVYALTLGLSECSESIVILCQTKWLLKVNELIFPGAHTRL